MHESQAALDLNLSSWRGSGDRSLPGKSLDPAIEETYDVLVEATH
jgi:hypothetical protein